MCSYVYGSPPFNVGEENRLSGHGPLIIIISVDMFEASLLELVTYIIRIMDRIYNVIHPYIKAICAIDCYSIVHPLQITFG